MFIYLGLKTQLYDYVKNMYMLKNIYIVMLKTFLIFTAFYLYGHYSMLNIEAVSVDNSKISFG